MDAAALYSMPLFLAGTVVHRAGQRETVNYVVLRRCAMMVYLVGHDVPVHPDELVLAPTVFSTLRMPERAGVWPDEPGF